jgi:hypothetical protein
MKKSYKILMLVFLSTRFLIQTSSLYGQPNVDELIFKAMNDELKRSSSELIIPPNKPPFFISYQLMDALNLSIRATLGAVTYSDEKPGRAVNSRVMAGDYSLTDENFMGGQFVPGYSLPLPIENDYNAIRRAFWITSDRFYKGAVSTLELKVNALKQQNKPEEEHLDDYSRIKPVNLLIKSELRKYDKSKWEDLAKELSGIFKDFPQLSSSSVELNFSNAILYVRTNEGTTLKIPYSLAGLFIKASIPGEDGENINDQRIYINPLPEQLPHPDQLKKDIKGMVENLTALTKAPAIEPYTGPVIFEESAVAEIFLQKIFRTGMLVASRNPVMAVERPVFARPNRLDDRINQKIMSENLTIKETAGLKFFNNVPLAGSYEIDIEGVRPKDELVLVEKGILKTLLTDRVPTSKIKESNGHRRFGVYSSFLYQGIAPGVLNIQFNNGVGATEVKKSVLKEAQERGLDYIYKVTRMDTPFSGQIRFMPAPMIGFNPLAIYKIQVKTGEEQLVRSAVLSDFQLNNFKYIPMGSKDQYVYNGMLSNYLPVSLIVPKVLVFDDTSLEKNRGVKPKLPPVPNPLKQLARN